MVYMAEYVNMWKNHANFSDRTTRRGYWMAFLVNCMVLTILAALFTVILPSLGIIERLYSIAVFIPSVAMAVRRFRDAGKHWANVFWCLLPIIGWIIMIVLLCMRSIEEHDGTPVV